MSRGLKRAAVVLLGVIACGTATSGATYTASSKNPQALAAAADFGVHVSVDDPGMMSGTRDISATATQTAGGTITQVVIQRSSAGTGSWTPICTRNAAPWKCSFDTTVVVNGLYDFRAIATDNNGYARTSSILANRRVDNDDPTVTLTDPGLWFRGVLPLSSTATDTGGSGMADVRYEYKTSAGSTWSTACTGAAAPNYTCNFNTGSLTDGQAYDFRAVATDGAGNSTISAAFAGRKPDNTAPNLATVADPGTNLRGNYQLNGSAGDATSGVASVRMQYSATGAGSWNEACADTTSPFASCFWDTTLLNGFYDVRAIVTDMAGNTTTSTVVANRRVDNTPPNTQLNDPGMYLRGTVTLTATGSDAGSGLGNLKVQYAPAGTGSWVDVCAGGATSPQSCSLNTAGVTDGTYDLRSHATDVAGNTNSSVLAGRILDNTAPTAIDVQTGNGGTTYGRIDVTDWVTFTYSETVKPSTILGGWDGSATTVAVFVDNRATNDRLYVYNAAKTAVLPVATELTLNRDYASADAWFTASMTQTGASIRVLLTALQSGSLSSPGGTPTMSWQPSASVTDPAGNPASTTPRGEQGGADVDF